MANSIVSTLVLIAAAVLFLFGALYVTSLGLRSNGDISPASSTTSPFSPNHNESSLTVGVFYYPWHTNNFHNGGGFLREQLNPPQLPVLGKYDDREVATIRQHLEWCMDSKIFLWVMSWWGPSSREEVTTDKMFTCVESQPSTSSFPIDQFKAAIFYETINRIREIGSTGTYDRSKVKPDIHYLADRYFGRPNHLKIDGKPVLFLYLTRWLDNKPNDPTLLQDVINDMREAAAERGYPNIYIVGDHAYFNPVNVPENYPPFDLLDAVTNYDVFGSMGRPKYADATGVQKYFDRQQRWSVKAKAGGCGFMPSISPGFSKAGYNPNVRFGPMSRRLNETAEEGSLFVELLKNAMKSVDEDLNMILINSFNEWHEDSQIEPIATTSGKTNEPESLTHGLVYESYGTLYLDLVKNLTLEYEMDG